MSSHLLSPSPWPPLDQRDCHPRRVAKWKDFSISHEFFLCLLKGVGNGETVPSQDCISWGSQRSTPSGFFWVLHLNKGDDNTRGHIGTELNNKAETVLQVTKSQTDANISEVRAMHIRDKDFEPFAFRINEESLPELVVGYEGGQKAERIALTELPDEKHQEALAVAFEKGSILGYNNLIDALKRGYAAIGYERGRNTLVTINKWLMSRDAIVKHDKTYSLAWGIYRENQHKPEPQTLFEYDH